MRLLCWICLLLAVTTPLAAPAALAGLPSAGNDTAPACISLVGSNGAVPATAWGQFTVVIRDLANNPVAGASVVVDFSSCFDIAICADQMDPNATVNCAAKTVRKFTGVDGSVRFTILGSSNGSGSAPTLLNGGRIFSNGQLVQSPTVSTFDLDGSSGVGANDLSVWLTDFGTGQPYGRSDYDCSGGIGANDLSFWLTAFGSGTMTSSCASNCP
jgi:hypothetical protein